MFSRLTRTLRSGGLDNNGQLYKGYWNKQYPSDKRHSPTEEALEYHLRADPNNMVGWVPGFDDCLVIDVDRGSETPSFQKLELLLDDYLIINTARGKHLVIKVSSNKQRISPPQQFTYGQCGGELIYKSNHVVLWDPEKLDNWLASKPKSNNWPDILSALKGKQAQSTDSDEDEEEPEQSEEIEKLLDEILEHGTAKVEEGERNNTLYSLCIALKRRFGSPGQFDELKQCAYTWIGENESELVWRKEVDQVMASAGRRKVKVKPYDFNIKTLRHVFQANQMKIRYNKRRLYPEVDHGQGWVALEAETDLIKFLNLYYEKLNLSKGELEKVRYSDGTLKTFYKVLKALGEVEYMYDPLAEAIESYLPLLEHRDAIFEEWRTEYGINSLDEVFIRILGVKDEFRIREFTSQFYTNICLKVLCPHYVPYAHSMLLTGDPGIGKSQAVYALLPLELADYIVEIDLETVDKETYILLTGRLLAIVEEMAGRSNYKVRKLKKLLTAPVYNYRELYAMRATDHIPIVSYVFVSNDEKASFEDEGMRRRLVPMEMSDWRVEERCDAQAFLLKYNKFLLALGYEAAQKALESDNFNPLAGLRFSVEADEQNRKEGMRTAKIDAETEISKLRNAIFNRDSKLMDLSVILEFDGVPEYAWTLDSVLTYLNSRYSLTARKLAAAMKQDGWTQVDMMAPKKWNPSHKRRRLRYWKNSVLVKDDNTEDFEDFEEE